MPSRSPTARGRFRRTAGELEALRYAARCAFTLDHQSVSLEDLARQAAFRGVGLARLRAWSDEEDWPGVRRQAVDTWRRRAQARLAAHVARRGQVQRDHLQALHDQAVNFRHQQVVQPRSWEQVAQIQLKTAQMLRDWQREDEVAMARLVGPQQGQAPAQAADRPLPDVTDEEALQAAHGIMQQRMAARLAAECPRAADTPLHAATAAALAGEVPHSELGSDDQLEDPAPEVPHAHSA